MREGRSVYLQESFSNIHGKLSSDREVWIIDYGDGNTFLSATKPSGSPTSVKWQYYYWDPNMALWHDDPALTVTSLSEKPSCDCEIIISLSREIRKDIKEPGVAGVYKAIGTYLNGRPVLQLVQHQQLQTSCVRFTLFGSRFKLFVSSDGCWMVTSGVGNRADWCLRSNTAPSLCPAAGDQPRHPREATDNKQGQIHWTYWSKNGRAKSKSSGISVKCNTHFHIYTFTLFQFISIMVVNCLRSL